MSDTQECGTRESGSMEQSGSRDRYEACLLGGAVGDALGAPVEFMSRSEIIARFGPEGIRDYSPAYGILGAITDDTQMTLFTTEGLIRSYARSCDRGFSSTEVVVTHAYGRWLLTQGETPKTMPFGLKDWPGWLFEEKALHSRRAPGNTCLSALRDKEIGETYAANNSKGCGAVMRMAPVGLAGHRFGWDEEHVFELGVSLGRLTHGHPTGYLSAGAFAVIVFGILCGRSLTDSATMAIHLLAKHEGNEEVVTAIELALSLANMRDRNLLSVPSALGDGWVGEEALAIGIYSALVADSFEQGVRLAVNIDGDSDSTGSISGNLLGAMLGTAAIPKRWLDSLELGSVVGRVAEDLFDCTSWDLSGRVDQKDYSAVADLSRRYPPN